MKLNEINKSRFHCHTCNKDFSVFQIEYIENNEDSIWNVDLHSIKHCPFCSSKRITQYYVNKERK